MRSLISVQLFLMAIIFCWLIPISGPKKIVNFYGRIKPFRQESDGSQIIWTVEVTKCDGCDKRGPKRSSYITKNGAFYVSLLAPNDDGSGIEKLDITIKSAMEIPNRQSGEKHDDCHREFTWTIRKPKFDIIHIFHFGHFRRAVRKDRGIYLKMQFKKSLPMPKSDISTSENPKNFIKYLIRVKRKQTGVTNCIKCGHLERIFKRELKDSEIQAEQPFKLQLVEPRKDYDLEKRLLDPREMEIVVEKIPICGICNGKKKKDEPIKKLSNCNDYVHETCINEHKAVKKPQKGDGESSTSGEEYKCPICNGKMEVKKDKDGNKEKNKAMFAFSHIAPPIKLEQTFMEFKLKMPILQNGEKPEFIYKFDHEDKSAASEKNYYNEFEMQEKLEDSTIIDELIEALIRDFPKSTVAQLVHKGNVPPPPEHNVDSEGASSSQPKSDTNNKGKGVVIEEIPPSPEANKGKNRTKSKKHSTKEKETKVEKSEWPMDPEYSNLVDNLFILASKEYKEEEKQQKVVEMENFFNDWEDEHDNKIANLSLDKLVELVVSLSQIKNFAEENEAEANANHIKEISEVVAVGWLREQHPSAEDVEFQSMLNYIDQQFTSNSKSDDEIKQFLKDGLNKKTVNGFKNFVEEEYAKKKTYNDRWKAVQNWAYFMSLEDLYRQIALTDKSEYEHGAGALEWLKAAIVDHNELHTVHMELKEHLEMAVIHKIFRRGNFQYKSQDPSKFMKELNDHEHAYGLYKSEREKLLQIVRIACVEPQNHKTYLGVYGSNHKVSALFWDYAKKYNEVLRRIWLSVNYAPPEHY